MLFSFTLAAHPDWPVWLPTAGWLLAATSARPGQRAPAATQRAAFKQAYAAAQQGGDGWRSLAAGLHDYPLYPYLQAAALEHDIQQTDRTTVESYLKQYPDWIPAADLRRDFLLELARRQDWNNFLAMYQPGLSDALTCDALQAQLANGGALDFDKDLATLWAKPNLPGACTPVLNAAHDQGLLTSNRLWTRIDRAADAGQGGTIASVADWLPADNRASAQQLALALRDPASAAAAATNWPDTPRNAAGRHAGTDAGWRVVSPPAPTRHGSSCRPASASASRSATRSCMRWRCSTPPITTMAHWPG